MVERIDGVVTPFAGHPGQVFSVALTSDDAQIVTTGDDCAVRIWDRLNGDQIGDPLTDQPDWVRAVAVTSDDAQIITGGDDGAVRIWDRVSGDPIGDPLTGHIGPVFAVVVTSDGAQIITAGDDGTVRIWDRIRRRAVGAPLTGHASRVRAIALTSADTQIITAGDDGTVRMWDRAGGAPVGAPLTGHTGSVFAVAVTSDDAQIVSAGGDGTVRMWDRAGGAPVGAPLTGHTGSVFAVAVTSDDAQIVSAGGDGTVRIWDRAGSQQIGAPLTGHILWVRAIAVTSDDAQIVTADVDGTVRIWDRVSGRQVGAPLTGHTARVLAIAITSDDTHIITASGDSTVRIWDRVSGEPVGAPLTGHTGRVFAVALTSDDGQIVTAGDDGAVRIWDRVSGRQVGGPLTGHLGRVLAVALTSDDGQIITGGVDGAVRIWDRVSGEPVGAPLTGDSAQVSTVVVTSDDAQIITADDDGTVRIWDRNSGEPVGAPLTGHTGAVFAVTLTSDDTQIISASDDGTLRIWDRISGEPVGGPLTGHTARVRALALTSDDAQIITGGEDGTIRIWDRVSGRQVAGTDFSATPTILADPHAGVVTDAESATDRLGITRDVNSVAALLAALGTAPPLSVALLGDWGSGKSSFMQQVINRVDTLADASKRDPRASAYAAHVKQVRFNAWHYSDDHLWVGLVEHLFRELAEMEGKLVDDLASEKARSKQLSDNLKVIDKASGGKHRFDWFTNPIALIFRVNSWRMWAEIRAPRHLLPGVVTILVGVALIVALTAEGREVIGWTAGMITVLAGLLSSVMQLWRDMNTFLEHARSTLQGERKASEVQIRHLEGQLDRIDPPRRLKDLFSEIGSPESYERYRGLTGRAKQDLDRISDELAAAREDWAKGKGGTAPPLQRIILYVDDLDRCTAARVVEILQAVNLLLSMSLFIVVVAVDPRWLQGALEDQHGRELGATQRHERSLDYLDKIFHIAYAVPPMGNRAPGYLRSLLPPVEDIEPAREEGQQARPQPQSPGEQTERKRDEGDQDTDVASEPLTVRRRRRPGIDITDRALRLRPTEHNFLPYLAPLLPTPRAIKKLTNIYRLLRIAVVDDQLDDFVGDQDGGPYQAAALLLAAVISAPAQAESFLAELVTAKPGRDIVDTLTSMGDSALAANLINRIEEIREVLPVHGDVTTYQKWGLSVARYSFETYRLFSSK